MANIVPVKFSATLNKNVPVKNSKPARQSPERVRYERRNAFSRHPYATFTTMGVAQEVHNFRG